MKRKIKIRIATVALTCLVLAACFNVLGLPPPRPPWGNYFSTEGVPLEGLGIGHGGSMASPVKVYIAMYQGRIYNVWFNLYNESETHRDAVNRILPGIIRATNGFDFEVDVIADHTRTVRGIRDAGRVALTRQFNLPANYFD